MITNRETQAGAIGGKKRYGANEAKSIPRGSRPVNVFSRNRSQAKNPIKPATRTLSPRMDGAAAGADATGQHRGKGPINTNRHQARNPILPSQKIGVGMTGAAPAGKGVGAGANSARVSFDKSHGNSKTARTVAAGSAAINIGRSRTATGVGLPNGKGVRSAKGGSAFRGY